MRLIDADLMKNNIISHNPNNEMEPILKKWIDAQKTVDAIPVEWLNQKYAENEPNEDKDYDRYLWDAIAYILTTWQKEQEEII